jgi:hypothetical protein
VGVVEKKILGRAMGIGKGGEGMTEGMEQKQVHLVDFQ